MTESPSKTTAFRVADTESRANNCSAAMKNPVLSTSWRTKENGAESDKHFGGVSNA